MFYLPSLQYKSKQTWLSLVLLSRDKIYQQENAGTIVPWKYLHNSLSLKLQQKKKEPNKLIKNSPAY